MEISFKKYNLDYFKDKDLYTWDEIIEKIEDMEFEVRYLRKIIKEKEEAKENEDFEYNTTFKRFR